MLESERDFHELATAMRRASSPDAIEIQLAYEADFAGLPQAALGVRVQDLTCDEHSCIGQVTAQRHEDIESFMMTAADSARYPIYTTQQVVVEDGGRAIRRFAISTDGAVSELPLAN